MDAAARERLLAGRRWAVPVEEVDDERLAAAVLKRPAASGELADLCRVVGAARVREFARALAARGVLGRGAVRALEGRLADIVSAFETAERAGAEHRARVLRECAQGRIGADSAARLLGVGRAELESLLAGRGLTLPARPAGTEGLSAAETARAAAMDDPFAWA